MKKLQSERHLRQHASPRYLHAVRLWQQYLSGTQLPPLDNWLAQALKKHRQFGKRDRYWYSEILFAAVRFGYFALFLEDVGKHSAAFADATKFESLLVSFAERYRQPEDVLAAWKTFPPEKFFHLIGKRYACENPGAGWPIECQLKDALRQRYDQVFDAFQQSLAHTEDLRVHLLWQGIPLNFTEALTIRQATSHWSTNEVHTFLQRQAVRPPLWIRLNYSERKAEVLAELLSHQANVSEYQGTLKVQCARSLFEFEAYQHGLFEIQDYASQQIGACVAAKPGECVWDCCAGEGGKTLQIAARMKNRGVIYASDIRAYKLKELRRRVSRAQFDNVRTVAWDGKTLPLFPLEITKRAGFDWVLVDASCTSTGTWRRNPDAKFRVTPPFVEELTRLQTQLLGNAARAVRCGGHLVYSTCSWLVAEDEAIVAQFLATHPNFQLIKQQLYGNPFDDADAMFSAVLTRES